MGTANRTWSPAAISTNFRETVSPEFERSGKELIARLSFSHFVELRASGIRTNGNWSGRSGTKEEAADAGHPGPARISSGPCPRCGGGGSAHRRLRRPGAVPRNPPSGQTREACWVSASTRRRCTSTGHLAPITISSTEPRPRMMFTRAGSGGILSLERIAAPRNRTRPRASGPASGDGGRRPGGAGTGTDAKPGPAVGRAEDAPPAQRPGLSLAGRGAGPERTRSAAKPAARPGERRRRAGSENQLTNAVPDSAKADLDSACCSKSTTRRPISPSRQPSGWRSRFLRAS